MLKGKLILIYFFLSLVSITGVLATAEEPTSCVVCGMGTKPGAKAGFHAVKDEKKFDLCSFSCSQAVHKKYPEAKMEAYDFDTGAKLDVKSAFFLIKSKNILKELEFGMAPTVVAFSSEEAAKKQQNRLKDGEIVRSYDELKKNFK